MSSDSAISWSSEGKKGKLIFVLVVKLDSLSTTVENSSGCGS